MSTEKEIREDAQADRFYSNIRFFICDVLKDDHGISERAYNSLCDLAESMNCDLLNTMLKKVDATDGRFYLPE